ncbi:MAG: Transcriptional regulatory protein OmpR [Alphaproteobacteria bacterium MarineAlpha6_Bin4]|nr:MAG: Transcriptional regulatory protein OmpR [Alphaproteobacteria bacterium MarineAlpha6_Bin3]PPR37370.1 MAG: Transcriptional regulatory protein OmpR [Alphaproteobacteria bacterium MarineAlpha6_Bin4]|tara:strand:+ start:357 stop:1043 length:687 start_codon:yes stop_codon:yes gene_type:complete
MKTNLPHILIVDDDKRILELINDFLVKNNFRVNTANNAQKAREKIENIEFDLIILDIMMPGESGLKLTNSLKKNNFKTPILLLSALGNPEDRIKGLEIGASDYLSKPFEPKELLLRMNNLIERNKYIKQKSKIVKFGPYVFNLMKETLKKNGKIFFLTSSELKLLSILAKNEGQPIFRYNLSKKLNIPNTSRALDVQITRLRNKIENNKKFPTYIQTVRGRGYVLKIE